MPQEEIVPGILAAGDIADVASTLAPHPLLLQGLVDGRNRLFPAADLDRQLAPVYRAYRSASLYSYWSRPMPRESNTASAAKLFMK